MKVSDIKVNHVYKDENGTKANVLKILTNITPFGDLVFSQIQNEFKSNWACTMEEFSSWAVEDLGEVEQ
jgi:hypothetical protein